VEVVALNEEYKGYYVRVVRIGEALLFGDEPHRQDEKGQIGGLSIIN